MRFFLSIVCVFLLCLSCQAQAPSASIVPTCPCGPTCQCSPCDCGGANALWTWAEAEHFRVKLLTLVMDPFTLANEAQAPAVVGQAYTLPLPPEGYEIRISYVKIGQAAPSALPPVQPVTYAPSYGQPVYYSQPVFYGAGASDCSNGACGVSSMGGFSAMSAGGGACANGSCGGGGGGGGLVGRLFGRK